MKKIIYQSEIGISIIIRVDHSLTIEQIAQKDVPQGLPYLIVDSSLIPSDRSQRHLWQADFTTPDGYGGQK